MPSIEKTLNWMRNRRNRVTYSMNYRNGPNSYDCSSAVFYALIEGGYLKKGTGIGNTDTLFGLVGKLLTPISRSEARYGDVFVSGRKGGSGGSAGHTGFFLANNQIIHCTYSKNGIAITNANGWMGDYSGLPVYCYRLKATGVITQETTNNPQTRKIAEDGLWGNDNAIRLQEYLGCAVRDGVISHQWKSKHNENIYAAQFDSTQIGSDVIAKLQKLIGVNQDRLFGPGSIIAFQKRMGTVQDGIISSPSDAVREMQRRLNKGTL